MKARKILVALCAIAGLMSALAPAHANDSTGPACSDIEGGDAIYTSHSQSLVGDPLNVAVPRALPAVEGYVQVEAPACTDAVRYTIYVLDESETVTLNQADLPNSMTSFTNSYGKGILPFVVPVTLPVPTVCFYVTTTNRADSSMVYDRAPDAGCNILKLDAGSPGYAFH